jgi:hypothetical protein
VETEEFTLVFFFFVSFFFCLVTIGKKRELKKKWREERVDGVEI